MAKTQDADTEFTPGAWHLARITVVRWASMPGVGAKEQNILVLQIKLAVLYRSPPTPPTPTPESQIAEFVGRAAVVYLVCTKDRKPATTPGRKFLGDAGIELAPDGDTGNPRANGDVWLRIQFGPPDPLHGFQSVVDWKPADAAGVAPAATTALRTAMPHRTPAFGLAFPRPGLRHPQRYTDRPQGQSARLGSPPSPGAPVPRLLPGEGPRPGRLDRRPPKAPRRHRIGGPEYNPPATAHPPRPRPAHPGFRSRPRLAT